MSFTPAQCTSPRARCFERLWMWSILVVTSAAVLQYFLTNAHPPIGVYVAILGLSAAAVTLREQPNKWEKAAWIFLLFAGSNLVAENGWPRMNADGQRRLIAYGKSVTLGRDLPSAVPPVLLMTLLISPRLASRTVMMSWNLTLGLLGTSMARVRLTLGWRKTL